MKFIIDAKMCAAHKLTPEQLFLLLSLRGGRLSVTIDDLVQRQVIVNDGVNNYLITQHWSDVVDEILADSTGAVSDEDRLTTLAKDFAKTFPPGKMPGTAYYYRCNTRELVLKFKKFFVTHPEYRPSEGLYKRIVEAGRRYNREMDLDPHYRVLAKYFISKLRPVTDEDGVTHNEETSQLASYLENEGQEDSQFSDWPSVSRN